MAALKKTGIKIDENTTESLRKFHIGKNLKAVTGNAVVGEQKKRDAFGELGNRAVIKNQLLLKSKDATTKENSKDCPKVLTLRNTKARVDSHWNKKILASSGTNAVTQKILTKTSTIAAVSNLNRNQPSSTITGRVVSREQKVPVRAFITKKKDEILRREDSNLTRRSINKIRAVLSSQNEIKSNSESARLTRAQSNAQNKEIITISKATDGLIDLKIQPADEYAEDDATTDVVGNSSKMLNMVQDIDINDTQNIFMLSEYVNDIYSYLYDLETKFIIRPNHLEKQDVVTPKMRTVLLDWINEVGHQFRLMSDTFHMSVGIIDRYLQAVTSTTKSHLQLVGVTALFIASKYEELYPADINDFVYITDNSYKKSHMFQMERKIMKTLNFELSRPIPLAFLRRFSKAAKADGHCHLLSKYILELCSIEYTMAHYKPSEIAASALYLSLQLFDKTNENPELLWTDTLRHYSHYIPQDLNQIVKEMAVLLKIAPEQKYKAVYNKYESSKFEKISKHPALYGSKIENIIKSEKISRAEITGSQIENPK